MIFYTQPVVFTRLHFYHLFTFRQMVSTDQLIIDISPIATSPTHRHAYKSIGCRNIRCSPAHRKAVSRKSFQWCTGSPIMGNLIFQTSRIRSTFQFYILEIFCLESFLLLTLICINRILQIIKQQIILQPDCIPLLQLLQPFGNRDSRKRRYKAASTTGYQHFRIRPHHYCLTFQR